MTKYLFTPWSERKNCFWLVRDFYASNLGVALPHYADYCPPLERARIMAGNLANAAWRPLEAPENHCLVAMGRGAAITHVGIWLEEPSKVLHLMENQSGRLDGLPILSAQFPTIKFFRYEAPNRHCP